MMNKDEAHFDLLSRLEKNPDLTQRELAKQMGVSLGKVNYCLKKLVERGMVKAHNFTNSDNKNAYAYLLTPKGIEEKSKLVFAFLKIKMQEYDALKEEISALEKQAEKLKS